MFDKDITVINKYVNNKQTIYKVSYVKGFWSSEKGISINGTQLEKSDNVVVGILMSEPEYQSSKEFKTNRNGWTLQKDDYLIKGKVENFTTITNLLENYEEVIKIAKIGTKDYGSKDMWHFAITGA